MWEWRGGFLVATIASFFWDWTQKQRLSFKTPCFPENEKHADFPATINQYMYIYIHTYIYIYIYINNPITWELNQPFTVKSWVPNGSYRLWNPHSFSMNCSHNGLGGGTPIAGWFMVENPVEMDDDWGYPISGNHYVSPVRIMCVPHVVSYKHCANLQSTAVLPSSFHVTWGHQITLQRLLRHSAAVWAQTLPEAEKIKN